MILRDSIYVPPVFLQMADVIEGFMELERAFEARRDPRGAFVSAHLVTVWKIEEWMKQGRFLNNGLVARYVIAFANAYRQAVEDHETGNPSGVPSAWRQAFEAARSKRLSTLQHLMLGINAHINYDLPHAVLQAGLKVDCQRCYEDHTRINEVLRYAAPFVRQRIANLFQRTLHVTNWIYGRAIDRAVADSFERAREHSWNMARAIAAAEGDAQRARVKELIGARAAVAGQFILRSKYAPARCISILHEVEGYVKSPKQSGTARLVAGSRLESSMDPDMTEGYVAL